MWTPPLRPRPAGELRILPVRRRALPPRIMVQPVEQRRTEEAAETDERRTREQRAAEPPPGDRAFAAVAEQEDAGADERPDGGEGAAPAMPPEELKHLLFVRGEVGVQPTEDGRAHGAER